MNLSRIELYDLVWKEPVTKVARRFGLSDVGLRKICKKHDIPTPPLGYWAKLAHGKTVRQTPLPPPKEGAFQRIHIHERPVLELPEEVAVVGRKAREHETSGAGIVVPAERPAKLHPLVKAADQALRRAKPDIEGFVVCRGAGLPTVAIAPAARERAILILDTLLKEAEKRSFGLTDADASPRLLVDGETFTFRIYSGKDRKPHVLTKEEIKARQEHEDRRRRWPTIYNRDWRPGRNWDYFATERLSIEVADPTLFSWNPEYAVGRWRDRKATRLETYLSDIMIALATAAAAVKYRRAAAEEKARLAAQAEERRRREEARKERAKRRHRFLGELSDDLNDLRKLERLHARLKEQDAGAGASPSHRLARVLSALVAEHRERFTLSTLDAEIERLGLFGDDDEMP